jgi:fumarate reductase subunit C
MSKTTWYLRNGRYRVYAARELTSFLVAFYSFYVICALGIIAAGDAARWDSFITAQQSTGWIVFHALALLYFLFYQTFPWFKLAPKAMPLQIGENKVPDKAIIIGHYVAWVAVSAFILWLAGVFS